MHNEPGQPPPLLCSTTFCTLRTSVHHSICLSSQRFRAIPVLPAGKVDLDVLKKKVPDKKKGRR